MRGQHLTLWQRRDLIDTLAQRRHPQPVDVEAVEEVGPEAPRRDLLPQESFLTTASLMATRGCHNRCDFCYLSTRGVRVPWSVKEPDTAVAEWVATGAGDALILSGAQGSDAWATTLTLQALADGDRPYDAGGVPSADQDRRSAVVVEPRTQLARPLREVQRLAPTRHEAKVDSPIKELVDPVRELTTPSRIAGTHAVLLEGRRVRALAGFGSRPGGVFWRSRSHLVPRPLPP